MVMVTGLAGVVGTAVTAFVGAVVGAAVAGGVQAAKTAPAVPKPTNFNISRREIFFISNSPSQKVNPKGTFFNIRSEYFIDCLLSS